MSSDVKKVPGSDKTTCGCDGNTSKCGCAPGQCSCNSCPKAETEKVAGSDKTTCKCGGDSKDCPCAEADPAAVVDSTKVAPLDSQSEKSSFA
ncbi:hypothetical protein BofuT4_P048700.1 [Botrytis cinerea T4]|uniref:Uncharacterized protein n=1 Tax=Botryotinia fuckeliana (strain T4) TaxID=999810 RepID=G2XZG5_BOTF4|nr:hypothetical protein BofuT4_P048700.1 [Botrytis cinerea T4]